MVRRFLFLYSALFILSYACSAQVTVKGKVTSASSRDPLAGVYVIWGKHSGSTTAEDGSYSFTANDEKLSVTFSFIGFRTETRTVNAKNGDEVTLDVALTESLLELDQVIVNAERREQKLSDLTVSLHVIKSDFTSAGHITDAQELLGKTPGIEVMDGQASVRGGSGFSYGVGSRVLAMIDGLPLLSPDAGGIRWQYLPTEEFSQVEITKGAASVLYGSSALNGMVNFRTREPGNIPETRIWTETGIYDAPANSNWKWWNTPRISSVTSFSRMQRMGNTDISAGIFLLADNSYRKYNDEKLGRISLRISRKDPTIKGLAYGISLTGATDKKTDFILWKNADDGALIQDTSSVSRLNGTFISVDPFVRLDRGKKIRHDLKMRIQGSENSFPARPSNNASSFSVYSEYQVALKELENFELTAGLSENWNRIRSNFYGNHDGVNLAIFTQAGYKPVESVNLLAGIRAENNILDGKADKTSVVFRAGLNYKAAGFTWLRASFGQGYRYPSIAEKYASTTLGSVKIIPNPELMSESGYTAEAGIKQGFGNSTIGGFIDLALFMSRNKNLIEYVFSNYTEGLGFKADNVERSRVLGCELEYTLTGKSSGFSYSLSGGYTYLHPVELTGVSGNNSGDWLKYRRKHSGKITAAATFKKADAGISFIAKSGLLNIDDVFVNPATREDLLPGFYYYWTNDNKGYYTADLNIGYRISPAVKISGAVKNLTNTEYMGRPGDIQPLRNYSIRITIVL